MSVQQEIKGSASGYGTVDNTDNINQSGFFVRAGQGCEVYCTEVECAPETACDKQKFFTGLRQEFPIPCHSALQGLLLFLLIVLPVTTIQPITQPMAVVQMLNNAYISPEKKDKQKAVKKSYKHVEEGGSFPLGVFAEEVEWSLRLRGLGWGQDTGAV